MLTQFYNLLKRDNFIRVSFETFKRVNIMWSISRSKPDDERCKAKGQRACLSVQCRVQNVQYFRILPFRLKVVIFRPSFVYPYRIILSSD
jgi:ribosomal protein L32E